MKDPLPKKKVVVRHLPPSLSQSDLLSQIDPRFADRYNWLSFHPGKSSYKNQKYSRAYVAFKAPEDVYEFAAFFNGHVFVNEKGAQFKAIVEYSPSQRVPKPCEKKDPREGSISKDPEYLEFLKLIAQPVENLPSAEIQLERREAEQAGTSKAPPVVTPLMEFIRQKRATVMGSQGLSDVRRGGRRARAVSANKPSPRPSKRNSDKKKYVEKDNSKIVPRKATSDIGSSKHEYLQQNSSGKEMPEKGTGNQSTIASVIDSSLPGIALTMDSGKKKILLLKSKDRDNTDNPPKQPEQQTETYISGSSSVSRQNQKNDVGGRLIKGILLKNDSRASQSTTSVQPEQRVESYEAENGKRPPRPANTRAGKDCHASGIISEKQDRRTRNKDRPDRVVWAPLRRGDGSNISEDQPLSSANNGEVKDRMFSQRSGEVVNLSGGHTLENGSARHSSRRVGGRNRKEDSMTGEGKSSRRGGGGGGGGKPPQHGGKGGGKPPHHGGKGGGPPHHGGGGGPPHHGGGGGGKSPPFVRPPPVVNPPPIVRPPPISRPPPVVYPPPTVRPPPITRPPGTLPPIISPPIQPPPVTTPPGILPPITTPPGLLPPIINPPPVTTPPPSSGYPPYQGGPPSGGGGGGGGGAQPTCPINALKLGACVDVLGGLIHIGLGNPVENVCCPVLGGLLELEAAVCLCTTIRLKLLNINIFIPLALQALITCGINPPPGFVCPPLP